MKRFYACQANNAKKQFVPCIEKRQCMMQPVSKERTVNVFLLAGPDAPTVKELMDLPPGMSVVGVGRPNKECAGELSG